jgi:predicted transposase YbfD/YdcC
MPFTVKKTFEAARDTGNILLIQIKANQPTLLDPATAICTTTALIDSAKTDDPRRHGRQEHRTVETFDATGRLDPEWDGLISAIVRVSRLTWHKDTKSGFWKETEEVAFYAAQAPISAAKAGAAIRGHWGIENRNHYVRDVSFFEDNSRIRIAPGVFARMRSFALNILRANAATNIGRELYVNALNPLHALAYRIT